MQDIKEDQESLVENEAHYLIGLLSATAEKIQFILIDQIIERNRKLKKIDPQAKDEYVLTAQRGSEILSKGHEVEIHGPCRIVYRPDLPHSCGATVWIETLATVTVFNLDGMVERVQQMGLGRRGHVENQ